MSHPVNRVCVTHKCYKEAQTKHYVRHPFNQQSNDMLCTLITWLLRPVAGCRFTLKPEINSDMHTLIYRDEFIIVHTQNRSNMSKRNYVELVLSLIKTANHECTLIVGAITASLS